jgi:hypothetical protein
MTGAAPAFRVAGADRPVPVSAPEIAAPTMTEPDPVSGSAC